MKRVTHKKTYRRGGGVSVEGYRRNSPDRFNDFNVIPSNRISMQGVDHPVLGIDDMGAAEVMLPGAHYDFPGRVVFEVPLRMRDGGMMRFDGGGGVEAAAEKENETERQRKWLMAYIQSPKYKERLQMEFGREDVDDEIAARLANVDPLNAKVVYNEGLPGNTWGEYVPKQFRGMQAVGQPGWAFEAAVPMKAKGLVYNTGWKPRVPFVDPYNHRDHPGYVYLEENFKPGHKAPADAITTPLHEFAHAADDGGFRMADSTIQKIHDYTNRQGPELYKLNDKTFGYVDYPPEILARIQATRYNLAKEGIYDAGTQKFTKDVLAAMRKNPTIQASSDFQELWNALKGNDDEKGALLEDLMNTVAARDSRGRGSENIAKYGGSIMKKRTRMQDGGGVVIPPYDVRAPLRTAHRTDTVRPPAVVMAKREAERKVEQQRLKEMTPEDWARYYLNVMDSNLKVQAKKIAKVNDRKRVIGNAEDLQHAYFGRPQEWSRERLAQIAQAIPYRFMLDPDETGGVGQLIDNTINPGPLVGGAAQGLGMAPKRAQDANSIVPYFTAVGAPLAKGALGMNPLDMSMFQGAMNRTLSGQAANLWDNILLPTTTETMEEGVIDQTKEDVDQGQLEAQRKLEAQKLEELKAQQQKAQQRVLAERLEVDKQRQQKLQEGGFVYDPFEQWGGVVDDGSNDINTNTNKMNVMDPYFSSPFYGYQPVMPGYGVPYGMMSRPLPRRYYQQGGQARLVSDVPQGYTYAGEQDGRKFYSKSGAAGVPMATGSGTPGAAYEDQLRKWLASGVSPQELAEKKYIAPNQIGRYQSYYKPRTDTVYTQPAPVPRPAPVYDPTQGFTGEGVLQGNNLDAVIRYRSPNSADARGQVMFVDKNGKYDPNRGFYDMSAVELRRMLGTGRHWKDTTGLYTHRVPVPGDLPAADVVAGRRFQPGGSYFNTMYPGYPGMVDPNDPRNFFF